MTSAVSLVRSAGRPARAVEEALNLIGSPLDRLKRGMRVVIKPNMFRPEPGFSTHPDMVLTLARMAAARGAEVTVVERTREVHKLLRGHPVHRYARVRSLADEPFRMVEMQDALAVQFPLPVPGVVLDCDYFIGVPQLHTHAAMMMSNALKNMVGILAGNMPRVLHRACVEDAIVDLNLLRPQDLVVCDATRVVEGNFPLRGRSVRRGLVAASTDAAALDVVMARVAGFDEGEIGYLRAARRRGLGAPAGQAIDVRGLDPAAAAFAVARPPAVPRCGRANVRVSAGTACAACKGYLAAAMEVLDPLLAATGRQINFVAGPLGRLPGRRGHTALVGNCLCRHRDRGLFISGCPPRRCQVDELADWLRVLAGGDPATPVHETGAKSSRHLSRTPNPSIRCRGGQQSRGGSSVSFRASP